MSTLTLPGDIPGLLRRGSPVRRPRRDGSLGQPYTVVHVSAAGWACVADEPPVFSDEPDHDRRLPGYSAGTGDIVHSGWCLDLTDPTGRAHAAWWLAGHHLQIGGGSAVGWSVSGFAPHWKLYGEGDCRTYGAPGSGADFEIEALTDLHWPQDGHGFDGPEALRRVVLHVAGRPA